MVRAEGSNDDHRERVGDVGNDSDEQPATASRTLDGKRLHEVAHAEQTPQTHDSCER